MDDATSPAPLYFSLRQAARHTGLSKDTIARKIKSGEISVAERTPEGGYRIALPELARYLDASRPRRPAPSDATDKAGGNEPETDARLAVAEAKVALLERQLDETRADRDSWREQATQAMRLLPSPPARRGWWPRWRTA
jgi:excisionase family DNA binding protein